MPAARAAASSPVSVRPETPMIGTAPGRPGSARMRRVASMPSMPDSVDVHQHDVVLLRATAFDRRLAAADEIDAVAELAQHRVHARRGRRDCPRRRARAARAPASGARRRRAGVAPAHRAFDHHGQPERAAAAGLAGDHEIAAHRLGDALDEDQAQAGAAVAPRHLLARLRERPEQSLEISPAVMPMPLSVTVNVSRTRSRAAPARRRR